MREHLRGIAESAVIIVPGRNLRVLDIGCNDGTLLECFPATFDRIGVDPSDLAGQIKPPIRVVNTLYPSEPADKILSDRKVDIVTSIAMFYDLEDPIGFAKSIKKVLSPNGIWIVEMSYLPLMLERNSLDTICHEHLEYYSVAVLDIIFRAAGLRVFKAQLNEINGGSIRCYVTHDGNCRYDTPDRQTFLKRLRDAEVKLELENEKPYVAFRQRIAKIRDELRALLQSLHKEGKTIHIYGASTKGNVLLQWCGIDSSLVVCASDRNPDKHGARTIGTNILIVSEEESRAMRPEYYLVLPWHFRDEFLRRERQTILNGTKMIFPLPQVTIVGQGEILVGNAAVPR
jgi:SAM-dependent methyltransferase